MLPLQIINNNHFSQSEFEIDNVDVNSIEKTEELQFQNEYLNSSDLLRLTMRQNYQTLNVMSFVSQNYKNIADLEKVSLIIDLLNLEKVTFEDLGVKTKKNLISLAKYLGVHQCEKITKMKLSAELLYNNQHDGFGCLMTEFFPNIKSISFNILSLESDVKSADINWLFLSKLSGLEALDLSGFHDTIHDIEFLEQIPKLRQLNLNCCRNVDDEETVLKKMVNLIDLDITNTAIENISFIQFMPNLQNFNVSSCYVIGMEHLDKTTQLVNLKFNSSNFKEVKFLKGLRNLKKLDLGKSKLCNHISDLGFLRSLTKLNLSRITPSDLGFLNSLNNLENLTLSEYCDDVMLLPSMEKIKTLDISESRIERVVVKNPLTELRKLNVSGCRLVNILFLEKMKNLEFLDISKNSAFQDLQPCTALIKLNDLNLSGCSGIIFRSTFSSIVALKTLNLSECAWVRDVKFLNGLSRLQSLNLKGCFNFHSKEDVMSLKNLKFLSADDFLSSKYLGYDERD